MMLNKLQIIQLQNYSALLFGGDSQMALDDKFHIVTERTLAPIMRFKSMFI